MNLLPGSSEAALVDLINSANPDLPHDLEVGDLYFGRIKTLPGGRVEIPAVTMFDSAYEGYVKLDYQRLSLTKAFGNVRPVLRIPGAPTLHQMLPVINRILGTTFGPTDIIDIDLSWLAGNESANIKLTASLQSLGYEGSFVITFQKVRPLLQDVVRKTELVDLHHPIPADSGVISLAMFTWAIDFTGNDRALTVYPTGIWQYIDAIRALCASHGLPDWPQAGRGEVVAYATKDLAESNKAYTNVVVHRSVALVGYYGDAYFHFNRS